MTQREGRTSASVRRLIQVAEGSDYQVAERFGVSRATVRRWRGRSDVEDRSHAPAQPRASLKAADVETAIWLRSLLQLPLDDLLAVCRLTINPTLSRSALHRQLQRVVPAPLQSSERVLRLDVRPSPDGWLFVAAESESRRTRVAVCAQATIGDLHRFLASLRDVNSARVECLQLLDGPKLRATAVSTSALEKWLQAKLSTSQLAITAASILQVNSLALSVLGNRTPTTYERLDSVKLEAVEARTSEKAQPARKRGRPVSTATREAILDAAESQFSNQGYNGVSIRDITHQLGMPKSLVTHHFGTKEELFRAVLSRRAEAYSRDLAASLEAAVARHGGRPVPMGDLLRALAEPILAWLSGEAGKRNYTRLLSQISAIPGQEALLEPYREHYAPVTRAYVAEIARSHPHLSLERVNWGFYFLEGVFVHIVGASSVLEQQTQGLCLLSDQQTLIDRLVAFFQAGFAGFGEEPVSSRVEMRPGSNRRKGRIAES